jgi:hypothetical protein
LLAGLFHWERLRELKAFRGRNMAHFAELDENNIVKRVIVVNNSDCLKDGKEDEATGIAFCENLYGGRWIKTSYNSNFRKHYAGVGYYYDEVKDAFIAPRPYPSWTLDNDCNWQSPHPKPDCLFCRWDEENKKWIEL